MNIIFKLGFPIVSLVALRQFSYDVSGTGFTRDINDVLDEAAGPLPTIMPVRRGNLAERIRNLRDQNTDLQNQNVNLQNQNTALQNRVQEKKERNDALRASFVNRYDNLRAKYQEVFGRAPDGNVWNIDTVAKTKGNTGTKYNTQALVTFVFNAENTLVAEINDLREQKNEEMDDLQGQINDLIRQIDPDATDSGTEVLRAKVEKLRNDRAACIQRVKDLGQMVRDIAAERDELRNQMSEADGSLA